jgi:methylase of polypeptide subunit release factors
MLTQVSARRPERPGTDPWFREEAREPLLALLRVLAAQGYDFVTATPATHARVIKRPDRRETHAPRDVLGWSLPFEARVIATEVLDLLNAAHAIEEQEDGRLKPLVRVSQVERMLFLHSAYPTITEDAVFLEPDSSRFAQLITACMQQNVGSVLDYGAGAGVGGIVAAHHAGGVHLTFADINPEALFLASTNAEHAGLDHAEVQVAAPSEIGRAFDLVVTHPPFMIDAERRTYRDGGDLYDGQLSLEWVLQGVDRGWARRITDRAAGSPAEIRLYDELS